MEYNAQVHYLCIPAWGVVYICFVATYQASNVANTSVCIYSSGKPTAGQYHDDIVTYIIIIATW